MLKTKNAAGKTNLDILSMARARSTPAIFLNHTRLGSILQHLLESSSSSSGSGVWNHTHLYSVGRNVRKYKSYVSTNKVLQYTK